MTGSNIGGATCRQAGVTNAGNVMWTALLPWSSATMIVGPPVATGDTCTACGNPIDVACISFPLMCEQVLRMI
jgi:hypothetical protein